MPGVVDLQSLIEAPGIIRRDVVPGDYGAIFWDGATLRIQLQGTGTGNVAALVVETQNGTDMMALDRDGSVTFAQNVTVTAGGVTITDGGIAVRGDARIRESMGLADITAASDQTYTAAQIVAGLITRDPNGGARTDTTPTGTDLETEINAQGIAVANSDTLRCYVINTADAAEAITIAGGTGVTISNAGQTIGQNESAILLFRRTAANTFTCYIIGA